MTSNGHSPSSIITLPTENLHGEEESITISQLQHLVRLIDQSDVTELEVKQGAKNARLVLRKAASLEGKAIQAEISSSEEDATSSTGQELYTITAPMVGIFQSWSKSKDKPLVRVGDSIKGGQHIGVICALDIPNEVEAAVAGRVNEILVQDGQPVEYGQPLMTIEQVV